MEQDDPTPVLFRKWHKSANFGREDIIAFLPTVAANYGHCMIYEHIGQHGSADYYGLLTKTELATPAEYKDLLAELVNVGYNNLVIYKRINHNWLVAAWNEITKIG